MKRTHHCAQLTKSDLNATVSLAGWVDSIRDHGGIIFVDLRDREGITQVKFDSNLRAQAALLKDESVIGITGKVLLRPEAMVNKSLPTGEIEIDATELIVHNLSDTPPFPLTDAGGDKVNEDLRLTYRYLDLRRPKMRKNLAVRHRATKSVRDYFDSQGFYEVETPALFKSTPEGAREYLVPSRIHPGQFYALSQSPQQFKQILMVAGVEKYFQIARCFRDEDLRADRQMEFTQIDVEVSFIDREGIYSLFEGMLKKVWKDVLGHDLPTPFPRMAYHDAMNRYGVDKPDTRFGFELVDFSDTFKTSTFKVFASTVAASGSVKAVNAKGLADITQGEDRRAQGDREIARREGPRVPQVRGRRMEVAHREVFLGRGEGRADQAPQHRGRRHRVLRRGPVGPRLRHPRPHPARGGPAAREARQADPPRRPVEFSVGRGFSAHVL